LLQLGGWLYIFRDTRIWNIDFYSELQRVLSLNDALNSLSGYWTSATVNVHLCGDYPDFRCTNYRQCGCAGCVYPAEDNESYRQVKENHQMNCVCVLLLTGWIL
jgi:hypothetical protein